MSLVGIIVTGGRTGNGGGIRNDGALTVRNSRITGNEAFIIGGGISSSGPLTLINSTVDDNLSQEDGGGIYSNGSLTVQRSTISGNTAHWNGAGVYDAGGALISETTISGNKIPQGGAVSKGGGIFVHGAAQSQIRNSTIVHGQRRVWRGSVGGWLREFRQYDRGRQ